LNIRPLSIATKSVQLLPRVVTIASRKPADFTPITASGEMISTPPFYLRFRQMQAWQI
jgi:hypothetical protein